MKQIAENRIFTVLSRSHMRGDEIAIAAGTFSHPRVWGKKVVESREETVRENRKRKQKGRQRCEREGAERDREGKNGWEERTIAM